MQIDKILVATDGSANAGRALDTAVTLARAQQARVDLVHAIADANVPQELLEWARVEHGVDTRADPEPSTVRMPGFGRLGVLHHRGASRTPHAVRAAVGQAILDDAAQRVREAGATVGETYLEDGDAGDVIASAIDQDVPDLTVLGTRGFGTLKGLVMGSVAHKVLGLQRTPCLIVP